MERMPDSAADWACLAISPDGILNGGASHSNFDHFDRLHR